MILSFCVRRQAMPWENIANHASHLQLFKELRTFRHQLILGLAISDFFMAANFLSSSAANLGGYQIGEHQAFCSFNGFMTQFFVIQSNFSSTL